MEVVFDEESGAWALKEEPYATFEVETKDDMDFLEIAIAKQKKITPVYTSCEISGKNYYDGAYCPRCNYELDIVDEPNYCPDCGQKLDWNGGNNGTL